MTRKANTHIRVTEGTWSQLNQLKKPGDSFEDVIQRLLDEHHADSAEDASKEGSTPPESID